MFLQVRLRWDVKWLHDRYLSECYSYSCILKEALKAGEANLRQIWGLRGLYARDSAGMASMDSEWYFCTVIQSVLTNLLLHYMAFFRDSSIFSKDLNSKFKINDTGEPTHCCLERLKDFRLPWHQGQISVPKNFFLSVLNYTTTAALGIGNLSALPCLSRPYPTNSTILVGGTPRLGVESRVGVKHVEGLGTGFTGAACHQSDEGRAQPIEIVPFLVTQPMICFCSQWNCHRGWRWQGRRIRTHVTNAANRPRRKVHVSNDHILAFISFGTASAGDSIPTGVYWMGLWRRLRLRSFPQIGGGLIFDLCHLDRLWQLGRGYPMTGE